MLESSKSQPHKVKIIDFVPTDAKNNNFFNGQIYRGEVGQTFEKGLPPEKNEFTEPEIRYQGGD